MYKHFIVITVLAVFSSTTFAEDLSKSLSQKLIEHIIDESKEKYSFSSTMEIISFQPDQSVNQLKLKVYAQNGFGDQARSIAIDLGPERSKGQIYLNIGQKYWSYYPKVRKAMMISPLATLIGDATVADILQPPPISFYDVIVLEENGDDITIAFTQKKGIRAPYGKIIRHYKRGNLESADFYTPSNILLKQVKYEKKQSIAGIKQGLQTEIKISNSTKKGSFSLIKISNLQIQNEIPESWFNPNNLQQVQ